MQAALSAAGIVPGSNFKPQDYQDALQQGLGGTAFLHCTNDNTLIEVICSAYNKDPARVRAADAEVCLSLSFNCGILPVPVIIHVIYRVRQS